MVIANTGLTASTSEVVTDVRRLKEEKPEDIEPVFEEYGKLVKNARSALIEGDISAVGNLMNRNHSLLQDITVSGEINDLLVDLARKNGALGAKMTGTGRGGLVLALAADEVKQDQIATAIEQEGYMVWKTTVG